MKKNILLIISMLGACFQANAISFNQNALQCFLTNASTNQNISNILTSCNNEMNSILHMTALGGTDSNYGALALKLFKDPSCREQILLLFNKYGTSCGNILKFN